MRLYVNTHGCPCHGAAGWDESERRCSCRVVTEDAAAQYEGNNADNLECIFGQKKASRGVTPEQALRWWREGVWSPS